ncbi:MAG TPA: recombination protein NinG, partial [Methanosarcina sp.]|nr:recombination protein NinG [Methanosarcina sp.]
TSIRPMLRFDERNIYGQCIQCNLHFHGNLLGFRKGILERDGESMVEFLEGNHEPANWTIDDLKSIRDEYKRKLKEIKK